MKLNEIIYGSGVRFNNTIDIVYGVDRVAG